jgi:large subunit ribosomal protein L25
VPAVVYGLGADTVSVTVPSRELQHILAGESGANTLITLDVDGESVLTLARQIHRHPTRGELVHVDFIRIRRDVAVSAEIPVHLLGEATGVRDGGLLEQLLFQLTVEAMPGNIPVSIEIDVSDLAIGDQLRVEDIPLPAGVETQAEPDFVVAQVAAPRVVTEAEEGEEGEAAEGEAAEGGEAPAADASDDAGDE